jgi:nitrate reductase cytochrome c-type subunit
MSATTFRLLLVPILAAGLLLACASSGGQRSDEEISLRRENLQELATPPAPLYALKDPGESKLVPRSFYGAPPLIPHSVTDAKIGLASNDCLDCHEVADKSTPGLPPSHHVKADFVVLPRERAQHGLTTEFVGFGKASLVAGNRYDCLLCHVAQSTNAASLVGNTFVPVAPKDGQKDAIDQLNSEGKY